MSPTSLKSSVVAAWTSADVAVGPPTWAAEMMPRAGLTPGPLAALPRRCASPDSAARPAVRSVSSARTLPTVSNASGL